MGTCFAYGNKLYQNAVKKLNKAQNIVIIGAGTMGTGIGIDLLNKTNLNIRFIDISDKALKKARENIKDYFQSQVVSGRMLPSQTEELLKRVSFSKDYGQLADAEIIWEVVTEKIEIKKIIFQEIEKKVEPLKLLFVFSNTSSHTTEELSLLFSDAFLREKFLTGHGYFPFHANRLFDVMKGPFTSEETFITAVTFASQMLEKKVIELPRDHHGYIADPIFEGMAAIVSWDIKVARDLIELPAVFNLITANPFQVLDMTGHMPYTECARHMGESLPAHDRLKPIYNQGNKHYPDWIKRLEESGRTGLASEEKKGFFQWEGKKNREKPVKVYNPPTDDYVVVDSINTREFWSLTEAKALDHRQASIQSLEALLKVALSDDKGGHCFRRYVIPIMLYALDLIQDGYGTAADINISTRVGLKFKFGLCEIIDFFIKNLSIDGVLALARKSADENPDRKDLFDVDGNSPARKGKKSLLFDMKARGWDTLLGYGRVYGTPVSYRSFKDGNFYPCLSEMRFVYPNKKDRVASIIFDNPLRGNVWNKYTLDQLDYLMGLSMDLYEKGKLSSILFTAAGKGMRMLGADARQFNRGWFNPVEGYKPLSEEEAAYFTRAGMKIFRFIQEMPVWTVGVFGEKWGGGAEFTYFLNQRFDLVMHGAVYDSIQRKVILKEKNNYNQPEIEYAILGGFGAVQELVRLGFGESLIDELFMQGLTATRAYQLGLSNFISENEYQLLEKAYEVARLKAKYAYPYSMALYNLQKKNAFREGTNDERLCKETGETFNPAKNPYVSNGLLRLLNMGGRNPRPDLNPIHELPGWKNTYNQLFD